MHLELELPRLVAAVSLLLGVVLCRRGIDDLLGAAAARLRPGNG